MKDGKIETLNNKRKSSCAVQFTEAVLKIKYQEGVLSVFTLIKDQVGEPRFEECFTYEMDMSG